MKKNLYCLYDKIANDYLPTFEANNLESAARMLRNTIKTNELDKNDFNLVTLCQIVVTFSAEGKSDIQVMLGEKYLSEISLNDLLGGENG